MGEILATNGANSIFLEKQETSMSNDLSDTDIPDEDADFEKCFNCKKKVKKWCNYFSILNMKHGIFHS